MNTSAEGNKMAQAVPVVTEYRINELDLPGTCSFMPDDDIEA